MIRAVVCLRHSNEVCSGQQCTFCVVLLPCHRRVMCNEDASGIIVYTYLLQPFLSEVYYSLLDYWHITTSSQVSYLAMQSVSSSCVDPRFMVTHVQLACVKHWKHAQPAFMSDKTLHTPAVCYSLALHTLTRQF